MQLGPFNQACSDFMLACEHGRIRKRVFSFLKFYIMFGAPHSFGIEVMQANEMLGGVS